MSDEHDNEPEANKPAAEEPERALKSPSVDEDGLPLDRPPTLDDVRSKDGVHGRFAMGCTIAIVALIVAFWLIRGGLGG